jgi:hypothetical protein
VPIGKYIIEVEGNQEYLPTSKLINLINDEDENMVTVFVGIKPKIETDFEFLFTKEDSTTISNTKLEAKAILLPN